MKIEFAEKISNGKYYYIIVASLLILFALMRIIHINADAPQDLSISAALYTDEGFKTYASRNYVKYGSFNWSPEDAYSVWGKRSPLPIWTYAYAFKVFGISFATIRSVSIVYALLTLILLFILSVRHYDRLTALVVLVLAGTSYFNVMFNRLGLYENHLLFFIMLAFFGFVEFFSMKTQHGSIRAYAMRSFFLLCGFVGIACAAATKSSFLMAVIGMVPALLLLLMQRLHFTVKTARGALSVIIFCFAAVYVVYAHTDSFGSIFNIIPGWKSIDNLLSFYLSLRSKVFAPAHIAVGSGMYLEFIFLQPLTFFISMAYAVYILYKQVHADTPPQVLDLICASWLFFGFFAQTLMLYHPSRYYLLFAIPVFILTARALCTSSAGILQFIDEKKPSLFSGIMKLLWIACVAYAGVIVYVQLVPFFIRDRLYQIVYPAIIKGDIKSVLYVIIPAAIFALTMSVVFFMLRKKIWMLINRADARSILLACIIALQLFQYGKWLIFHEHELYTANKDIERIIPEQAIIAGSWSAGLTVENGRRPVVVQMTNSPNHALISKILKNDPIQINGLAGGKKIISTENNLPLYLAICPSVIFEKDIYRRYKAIMLPERLIKKYHFGYFEIELYNIGEF